MGMEAETVALFCGGTLKRSSWRAVIGITESKIEEASYDLRGPGFPKDFGSVNEGRTDFWWGACERQQAGLGLGKRYSRTGTR